MNTVCFQVDNETSQGPFTDSRVMVLFDLWKTLARGPFPEPIKLLKGYLNLDTRVSDEEFLVACLTTSYEDPDEYVNAIGLQFGVPVSPTIREKFRKLVENERRGLCLFTEVLKLLSQLKEMGFRIGMVTNSWSFPVRKILTDTQLDAMMDVVVSSHEAGMAKQQGPGIYFLAAERAGVPPHLCIMVGDNPDLDIFPAMDAGMRTVLIDRYGTYDDGNGSCKDQRIVDMGVPIVRDLEELLEFIAGNVRP